MNHTALSRRLDAIEQRLAPKIVDDDADHPHWLRLLWAGRFVNYREWRILPRDVSAEELNAAIWERTDVEGMRAFLAGLAAMPTARDAMTALLARIGERNGIGDPTHNITTFLTDVHMRAHHKTRFWEDPPAFDEEETLDIVRRSVAREWETGRIAAPPWERRRTSGA